ncbi:MAG: TIGR03663 family protein [Chloroflexi bacterium]|nr:TIGR03663 family protein [Chloroflexota bacterium]
MATITEPPAYSEPASSPLSQLFSRSFVLNAEVIAYVVIFLLAIFTRFYALGDRVMSHDESLHTRFSWNLYNDNNFQHTPLMHGPILFHAVAFNYFLFGDNDFTARIYTSVLGVGMVMFPLLFRRWLGKSGAILAALMILISPLLMYYNRYIREDTPSIFFTLIMVYCTFMYLSGPESQRRRAHWLYIFAAAMLGSLGSKESAFMYLAIFFAIILVYWCVRLAQQYAGVAGKTWFYVITVGILLAGVAALGMYIVLDITPLEQITAGTASALAVTSLVTWIVVIVTLVLSATVATLMWAFRDESVQFGWLDASFIAFVAALFLLGALFGLWLAGFFLGLAISLGYAFARLRPAQGPWTYVVILLLIAIVTCIGLIVIEELSHVSATPNVSTAPIPGQGEDVAGTGLRPWLLYVQWALMAVVIGGVIWMARVGLWRELKRLPEFDLLMLMGTLILPWSTAFIIKAMGANPTILSDTARVVAAAFGVAAVFDYGTQVFLAFLTVFPMLAMMVAIGLGWDARRWFIAALIFHVLFAFFFTTVFTNIAGLATGMVGSLGYWLEQQGVRRGSQPQYYYLAIIMPFYEFLPIVGSLAAMFSGLVFFWRHLRRRLEREQLITEAATDAGWDAAAADNTAEYDPLSGKRKHAPEEEVPSIGEVLGEIPPSSDSDLPPAATRGTARRPVPAAEYLDYLPFLLFVSWWAIFNAIAYTLAGEKMPWLGTHLTTPLILLSGWFFGMVFEKVDLGKFLHQGWMYLLAFPLLFVVVFNLITPFFSSARPFMGLSQLDLQQTFSWLAGLLLLGLTLGFVWWLAMRTGWAHLRALFGVAVFGVLALITFRSAWISSFINYDYALEPLVYAHSAPAVKTVLDQIEELSFRTTDGMGMLFAYDDLVSWPYSWYFRDFTAARFMPSGQINVQSLNGAVVVVVGEENRAVVEPLLGDSYYRFEYIRMWWPLQDYFGLTAERVVNTFDMRAENQQAALIRQGIFEIWWNRDYSLYASAVGSDLATSRWPVRHRMYVYVRRDVAAQVWQLGTGELVSTGDTSGQQQTNLCISNWQERSADLVFGTLGDAAGQLGRPLGVAIAPDGNIYVAEENNNRISVFDPDGSFVRTLGQFGGRDLPGLFFTRPNAVAFGPDGTLYVADTWNYRIQRFDANGNLLSLWGQPLESGIDAPLAPSDGFWAPRAVAVDADGLVYVADTGNKRVRVYGPDGDYVRDIGTGGSALGQLEEPVGLAIDNLRREIYVAEWWNRRVSVFTLDGLFVRAINVSAWYEELGNRSYLALDSTRGLLYITDPDAARILVYDTQGDCVGAFGQSTRDIPSASNFYSIGGLVVDAAGNLYVADSGAGRILRFAPFINAPSAQEATAEVSAETTGESPAEVTAETTAETTPESTAEATPEATQTPSG